MIDFKLLPILLCMMIFAGCGSNGCEGVVCGSRSNCVNGRCFCWDGYEGDNCEDLAADKYIGTWQVSPGCVQGFVPSHVSQITADPFGDPSIIVINNFMNSGLPLNANIFTDRTNRGNLIQFQGQVVGANTVDGQGFYNPASNQISLDIQYFGFNGGGQCTFIYFK